MRHRDSLAGAPPSSVLEHCLRRALRKQKLACKDLKDEEAVHDFRVALRRCRSLAEVFSDLDPYPAWRHLRKLSRKKQRILSDLRDVQVLMEWIRKLGLTAGTAGTALTESMKQEERRARRTAASALGSFPRKHWKRWLHTLPARADLIPVGEPRLAGLALERLIEAQEMEGRWRKARGVRAGAEAWHKLRIGVKRYRYTVESFLPKNYAAWKRRLKRLQDVLGEGHDLDVLRAKILERPRRQSLALRTREQWVKRIDRARRERVAKYERAISLPAASRKSAVVPSSGPRGKLKESGRPTARNLWDRWRAALEALALVSNS